jgi:hypothetical protein
VANSFRCADRHVPDHQRYHGDGGGLPQRRWTTVCRAGAAEYGAEQRQAALDPVQTPVNYLHSHEHMSHSIACGTSITACESRNA